MSHDLSRAWVVLAVVVFTVGTLAAQNEVPQAMKIQGFITNAAGTPIDGPVSMTFDLYDAPVGGNFINRVGPFFIQVSNGVYNADLNFSASDFGGQNRFIEHTINGEVLSPRSRVVSAPYAYRSESGGGGVDGVNCWDLDGNGARGKRAS